VGTGLLGGLRNKHPVRVGRMTQRPALGRVFSNGRGRPVRHCARRIAGLWWNKADSEHLSGLAAGAAFRVTALPKPLECRLAQLLFVLFLFRRLIGPQATPTGRQRFGFGGMAQVQQRRAQVSVPQQLLQTNQRAAIVEVMHRKSVPKRVWVRVCVCGCVCGCTALRTGVRRCASRTMYCTDFTVMGSPGVLPSKRKSVGFSIS
jgi:hypothetical protein